MFKVGQIVEHILSRDWLLVLDLDNDRTLCRTKDHKEIWFYNFELQAK